MCNSCVRLAALLLASVLAAGSASGSDWPQFQYDAANQGRAPQAVEPPFQLRWVWYGEDNVAVVGHACPEGEVPRPPNDNVGLLSFTMHAVVADGRVIFGDLTGKLFCLDSRNGAAIWKREFPGAFIHAAAICKTGNNENGNIIVAPCQDGHIYGLDWQGRTIWRVQADRPFVTPAKISGGTAYAGSLDGTLYAVDVASGKTRWCYDAGGAIRQPAAIANGCVFFGSENMIFHAVDAATGKPLWRTRPGQMTGQSFRNTWPVVVGDKVMTFQILVDGHAEFVMEALLFNATPGNHTEKRLADWPQERQAILNWLNGDMTWAVDCQKSWQDNPGLIREDTRSAGHAGGPLRKSFFVFNIDGDGQGRAVEPYQVPMGVVGGTGNSNMGPVLDARGRPITWWRVSARSIITGGSFGTAFSPDLSGLDLATGDRVLLPTERDIHKGGPGMELDNHHMLTAAGDYIYYHNPFRQARWIKLDGRQNPQGAISSIYRRFDGGGWPADVVYYPTPDDAGPRGKKIFFSHGAARTPIVIADDALFVNEIDLRALACYETLTGSATRSAARRGEPEDTDVRPTQSHHNSSLNATGSAAVAPASGGTCGIADAEKRPIPPEAGTTNSNRRNGGGRAESDSLSPTHRDLSHYIWQKRSITNIRDEASRLKRILAEQVHITIHSGHLLPYYCMRGENNPRWYFTNPADTIAALSRAYPYLPDDLQAPLLVYLLKELETYPPFSDRLNEPGHVGTSRMDFEVPEYKWQWREGRLYRQLPRLHNVYSMWAYMDATGDDGYVRRQWPDIRAFYDKHRRDMKGYMGGVSGAIALARLAHAVGDEDTLRAAEQDAIEALRAVRDEPAMRAVMFERYGFRNEWQREFNFRGFHLLHMTPEVARCIADDRVARDAVIAHVDEATLHWPMWFISQASTFTRYYGESHAISPLFSAMIFPTMALVRRADPAQLAVWVDAEDAPRGDLFFIERLVLAIEAHGEERWVDAR